MNLRGVPDVVLGLADRLLSLAPGLTWRWRLAIYIEGWRRAVVETADDSGVHEVPCGL